MKKTIFILTGMFILLLSIVHATLFEATAGSSLVAFGVTIFVLGWAFKVLLDEIKGKERFPSVKVYITFLVQSGQEEIQGFFDGEKIDICIASCLIAVGAIKIAIIRQFDRKTRNLHCKDG